MSRNINWDAPLTKDDLAWLGQRMTPEIEAKLADHKARLSKKSGGEGTDKGSEKKPEVLPVEFTDDYDKWKVDELKAEAEGREPAIDVSGMTKKAEFVAALRTWDAAHPDAVEV